MLPSFGISPGLPNTTPWYWNSDRAISKLFARVSNPSIMDSSPLLSPQNSSVVQTPSQSDNESSSSFIVLSRQDSSITSTTSSESCAVSPTVPKWNHHSFSYTGRDTEPASRIRIADHCSVQCGHWTPHCGLAIRDTAAIWLPRI